METRRWIRAGFAITACALAIVFSALGFWQLRRLSERRAQNVVLSSRRFGAPVELSAISTDTAAARFRRVRVSGRYDYGNQFALTLRTRNGSPGVDIITPVSRAGTDTLVLVNRGWIYAPDGMTADIAKWPEGDSVNAIGFVETFPAPSVYGAKSPGRARAYRWLERSTIETDLHHPVAPYYVMLAPDSETGYASKPANLHVRETPPRVEPRGLDEGPHKSYAIQWFSFAATSILGLFLFLRRS
ncbi:MAG: SURF1 family protein [Gemmatimonadota bacterium]|nr:SURF1 family protein [Gemmatimonadota bacterium]